MRLIYVQRVNDKQLKALIAKGFVVIVKGLAKLDKALQDHVL